MWVLLKCLVRYITKQKRAPLKAAIFVPAEGVTKAFPKGFRQTLGALHL